MVAEGLSSLVREAEDKDLLAGVKVSNGNLKLPLLQYVDDAIFFFRKGIKDTITLKTILRCFELVTGLKVNFSKSSLVSINVDQRDCLSCARILNCNTMSFPFTYLGLPVGVDTRKISTWQPVIDKLKKKLAQWRRRHLSFGGRICLMRWVLSSIPFYFLSLFKIPRKVIIVINGIKKNSLES